MSYAIRQIAELTGLDPATLRKWEERCEPLLAGADPLSADGRCAAAAAQRMIAALAA